MARAVLLVGCLLETKNRFHAEEIDEWVWWVSSTPSVKRRTSRLGCVYVPEMMIKEAEEIVSMWRAGARFCVCGMKKLADGIGEVGRKIVTEVGNEKD